MIDLYELLLLHDRAILVGWMGRTRFLIRRRPHEIVYYLQKRFCGWQPSNEDELREMEERSQLRDLKIGFFGDRGWKTEKVVVERRSLVN